MDHDTAILRKAERLELVDLDTYADLDHATAEEVSDAADRVTARYHALMKDMPVMARVAMAGAPGHPTEASVAKGALMLTLIEDQTASRPNEDVDLQSVHDNVTYLMGDGHFFEILDQDAAACALAVYCQTAALARGSFRLGRIAVAQAPHADLIGSMLEEHGFGPDEEILLSRYAGTHDHAAMLTRILA